MEYKIVNSEELHFLGISVKKLKYNANNEKLILKLWESLYSEGFIEELESVRADDTIKGVMYDIDTVKKQFSFLIGVQTKKIQYLKGMVSLTLPKHKYLVFEHKGALIGNINSFKSEIMTDFIPFTNFDLEPIAEIEVYYKGGEHLKKFRFDYWLSIK